MAAFVGDADQGLTERALRSAVQPVGAWGRGRGRERAIARPYKTECVPREGFPVPP